MLHHNSTLSFQTDIFNGSDFVYATMVSPFITGSNDISNLKVIKIGKFCFLTGRIIFDEAPTVNAIIAKIPSEYSPPIHHRFQLVLYGTTYITIGINANGDINYLGANISNPTGTTYGTAFWVCNN